MEDKYETLVVDNITRYYKNGILHREDRPAVKDNNGYEAWYYNGKRHREDGPARIWSDGSKEWFINGNYHREDGPAIEYPDGTGIWFINNYEITKEVKEWMTSNNIPDYKVWTNKEIALFKLKFL